MQQEESTSAAKRYALNSQKMIQYPRDEFELKAHLLDTENKMEKEYDNAVSKFSLIVNKDVLCSNISNDTLMRLYQNDVTLLTHMFSIAVRAEEFDEVLKVLYYGWKGELGLTRTKDGEERKHQARGNNYNPREPMTGFSGDLPQEEKSGFDLGALLNRGRKQQG